MAMKEFRTAAKRRIDPKVVGTLEFFLETEDETEVDADGKPAIIRATFKATEPTTDQMVLFIAAITNEDQSEESQFAALFDFLRAVIDDKGFTRLKKKLNDRNDPTDIGMLFDIAEWLVEQWSQNPTIEPSGSSSSPEPTGQRSTGRAPGKGSTLSASARPGS